MTRSLLLIAIPLLVGLPAGAAERGLELYDTARRIYWELHDDGPKSRDPTAWEEAAERFREVTVAAPDSAKADDALYMEGLCLERANALSTAASDRDEALQAYNRLARDYPHSNLADDALLRAGRIVEAWGDTAIAGDYYRKLLREQSDGDMAPVARRRLARLGEKTVLQGVRFWSGTDYTRVVVDLSHSAAFLSKSLPADPRANKLHRIYLDFNPARLARSCPNLALISDGLVRQVRTGQHNPKTARVVLDLDAPTNFRVFPLYAPARVVIDVFRATRGPDVIASIIAEARQPPAKAQPEPRRLRIAVDAGHGGKDPGAVGPKGLKEKDVTLAIAKELSRLLRATLRCEVKLTRDRDVSLSLEERTAVANAFGADLFISVHVNANRSPRVEGVETYYLDRASDRAARRLAARENASGETDLAEIEHILKDVLLTSKIQESRRLAKTLQAALVSGIAQDYGSVRDLGVKRGPFYVLTGAAMPAVLVETSFITHPGESKRLRDVAYLRTTARAMAKGVERFVEGG